VHRLSVSVMMGVLARREQENFVKTPTELKASVNGAQCDASSNGRKEE